MQKLFTWLKVYSFPLNVGGFEKEPVVCGIGGSGRHWLWCVATWMSVKQRHSKCSKLTRSVDTRFQSSSPLIDRIIHHTLLSEIQPCLNKPLPPLVHIVNWYTYTPVSCSRCGDLPDLDQDSGLLAGHVSGLMNWAQKLDCVASTMYWCTVLLEDKHVSSSCSSISSIKWTSSALVTLFQMWWTSSQSRLHCVLFWDNANDQKCVVAVLLKMTFLDFPR